MAVAEPVTGLIVRTVALVGLEDRVATAAIHARLRAADWTVTDWRVSGWRAVATSTTAEQPDVWLVGGARPVAIVAAIVERHPAAAVIVLTGVPSEDEMAAAIRAGALGYLVEGIDLERLPVVLAVVAGGEPSFPRSLTGLLARNLRERPLTRLSVGDRTLELTEREAEVLQLLRAGRTTRQIAAGMHIAAVTVRTHIMTICRKARVPDRQALLALLER